MTPERIARLRWVLDRRQPDLTVVTDFVHKQRNLSAIVRNCDAAGVALMHAVLGDADYQAFRGTAMGSHRWVEVQQHRDALPTLDALRQAGHQLLIADPGEAAVDFREVDYTRPTAIVLGAERRGVSEQARALADAAISVPMVGMVGSLNVSVASGIILTEAQRQRRLAGMYERARLAPATYQRLLFEWGHPRVRDFCKQRGLAYPALDEDGEIANAGEWYASVRTGKARRANGSEDG
jgi:tRNA (guanosine-2'-O-)-methyltransferase